MLQLELLIEQVLGLRGLLLLDALLQRVSKAILMLCFDILLCLPAGIFRLYRVDIREYFNLMLKPWFPNSIPDLSELGVQLTGVVRRRLRRGRLLATVPHINNGLHDRRFFLQHVAYS